MESKKCIEISLEDFQNRLVNQARRKEDKERFNKLSDHITFLNKD